jgi:predicted nucleotidyltransferase
MTSLNDIKTFAQQIATRYSPEKILLFGSHARGDAGKYSDVDLLLIMNYEGSAARLRANIRGNIPFHHSLDLLVRKPDDIAWRLEENDFFIKEIMNTGLILYEANH